MQCAWLLFSARLAWASLPKHEYKWTYDVDLFGGPDFWGLVNNHWRMCKTGQAQSPINIDPSKLLFDPHLGKIHIDIGEVEGILENSGQLPIITINDSSGVHINISGGAAVPYKYRLAQIMIHFGKSDGGEKGSEHTIDRVRFPAEVQLLAYNSDLYDNLTHASTQPRGLLAIAVIVDMGKTTEPELRRITVASQSIIYQGNKTPMRRLNPAALLPRTHHYVTYEGSLTFPGCDETVTWVIMNNPIYITREDLAIWNELQQSPSKTDSPQSMTPVYRPLRALNGRLLRTNINVSFKPKETSKSCPIPIYSELGYRANPTRLNYTNAKRKRGINHHSIQSLTSAEIVGDEDDFPTVYIESQ